MGGVEKSSFYCICINLSQHFSQLFTPRVSPYLCVYTVQLCSAGVGKSSLLLRFADNLFSGTFSCTAPSCNLRVLQATPFAERKGLVTLQPSSCH